MRAQLGGDGTPIPDQALPDSLESGEVPVIVPLVNGVPFIPQEYIDLGYTHYEVWCMGGAGGRGGGAADPTFSFESTGSDAMWDRHLAPTVMSTVDWTKYHDLTVAEPWRRQNNPDWPYGYVHDWDPVLEGNYGPIRWQDLVEWMHPEHLALVVTYTNPRLLGSPVVGGAGGGGGLHVVAGRLDSLPASVPVSVGAAGADAPVGQIKQVASYDPVPSIGQQNPVSGRDNSGQQFWDWYTNKYPAVHPSLQSPQAGGDGGYSSFGTVAKASGGKGGDPSIVWVGGSRFFRGKGGAGGIGNRTTPGGGGAGAGSFSPGKDGDWDGIIGAGGGGGRGGFAPVESTNTTMQPPTSADIPFPLDYRNPLDATEGGRGAFSYSDTSIYGPRGAREYYSAESWRVTEQIIGYLRGGTAADYMHPYDYAIRDRLMVRDPDIRTAHYIIPGGGGSAKLPGGRRFGSSATGFSPRGAVLVRLKKIA